jgi:hypothetical protein
MDIITDICNSADQEKKARDGLKQITKKEIQNISIAANISPVAKDDACPNIITREGAKTTETKAKPTSRFPSTNIVISTSQSIHNKN